jgi:hypothetical protein
MDSLAKEFDIGSKIFAVISAITTAMFFWNGFEGITGVVFAIMGVGCCWFGPKIWAFTLTHWRDMPWTAIAPAVVAGVLVSSADAISNFGTLSAVRGTNIVQGETQEVRFQNVNKIAKDNEGNLETEKTLLASMRQ